MDKITLLIVGITLWLLQVKARPSEEPPQDAVTVFFEKSSYTFDKLLPQPSIFLHLSKPMKTDVTVTIIDKEGTATRNMDYRIIPSRQTVTFKANNTRSQYSGTFLLDDDVVEVDETFDILIDPSSLPEDISLGDPCEATVTIKDDDSSLIYFNQSEYSVDENSGIAQPAVILRNQISIDITVQVNSNDITAKGDGIDYDSGPYVVNFPAGNTSATFNVSVNDDKLLETNERFSLSIGLSSLPSKVFGSRIAMFPYQSTVVIIDDDKQVFNISFSQSTYAFSENRPAQPILVLSDPLSTDITVQIMENEGTAKRGSDYGPEGPYNVTIPANQTRFPFVIKIINDSVLEENESFTLIINAGSLPTDVGLGNLNMTTVTIVDDDTATISFEQQSYTVNEADGKVEPVLVLSNPSSTVITIEVLSSNGSAIGKREIFYTGRKDYNSGPFIVQFKTRVTRVSFNVTIDKDDVLEANETFNLFINQSSLPSKVTVTNPDQATVTIVDNDVLRVEFDQTSYLGLEKSGHIPVTLLLKGGNTSIDITVTVTPSDQSPVSAEGGSDYNLVPIIATFTAGSTSTTVNIALINDSIVEEPETFDISLTIPPSLSGKVELGAVSKAIVNITDDTITSVRFDKSTYSVNESNGTVQPILLLSNPSSNTITVEVISTDATAFGRRIDYDSGPYTVTFSVGLLRAVLSIPIINDTILEGDEIFNLSINKSSLQHHVTVSDDSGKAEIIIVDDDVLTVEFSQATYSGLEASGVVSVTLLLRGGNSSNNITVTVIPADQSTVSAEGNGVDYDSSPITAIFTAGSTSTIVNVPVNVDDILEEIENFDLSFTIPSSLQGKVIPGTITKAVGSIIDNTTTMVNFFESTYGVDEDSRGTTVLVFIANISSTNTTVEVFNNDITAFGGGIDYGSGPYPVIIPAGQTAAFLNVTVNDDNILEEDEKFNLTINPSSLPNNVVVGDHGQTTVTILDNDELSVEFDLISYIGSESSGLVSVTLSLRGGTSSRDITVTVTPSDQSPVSAEGNKVDYDSAPINATFAAGSISVMVIVPVIMDDIVEGPEKFNLSFTINPSPLSNRVIQGNTIEAVGTITDDTITMVKFDKTTYRFIENEGVARLALALTKPSSINITVEVFNSNATAFGGGVDYESGPYRVTIPAGKLTIQFNIVINDDNILERDENFGVTINATSLPSHVNVTDPYHTTVTILDNDAATISFDQSAYIIDEAGGPIQPVLVLTNPSSVNIAIRVNDTSTTATGGGTDYTSGPYTVTFSAGSTRASFDVSITNDTLLERDETFILTIDLTSLPSNVKVGISNSSTVTIMDDEVLSVEFGQMSYIGSESSGLVSVTLSLRGGTSSRDITVTVTPSDQSPVSAEGNKVDYDSTPIIATIIAGSTSVMVNVPVIMDNIVEKQETFNLTFTINPSPLSSQVTKGNIIEAVGIITDNTTTMVKFNKTTYHVNEDEGPARPVLVLTNPSSINIIVEVLNSNATAFGGGVDYESGPYRVIIPAGQLSVQFDIAINDDNILESDENFDLAINATSLPDCVVVTGPNQATVIILDNDAATISFDQSAYSIAEDGGPIQPVLILSNPSSVDIIVQVVDTSTTATGGGIDYTSGPYIVTFSAISTRASFNVSIKNDTLLESDETFILTINSTSLPRNVTVGISNSTVTIMDDEVLTVQFAKSTFSGMEASGNILVALLLGGGTSASNITVTVIPFDQSPVSAQGNGLDYTSTPIPATFSIGAVNTTVSVQVTKDDIVEEVEAFNLNISILSSLSGRVILGNTANATCNIIDDTVIVVQFDQAMYTVDENNGIVQVTLILSNPSASVISIEVLSTDKTAYGKDVDYGSGPYIVMFPVNSNSASFNVSITNDNTLEQNETFTLTLNPPDGVIVVDPDKATVNIVDDDTATISFNQSEYSVDESERSVKPVLILSNPSSTEITLQVRDEKDTATGGDYVSGPYDVVIPAGQTNFRFDVVILNDNLVESDESFVLAIIPESLLNNLKPVNPESTRVTIVDNDVLMVRFSNITYSGTEESGAVSVTLLLEGGTSNFNITVTVIPSDQSPLSAEGNGVDYTSNPINATFAAGSASVTVNVLVTTDTIVEPSETFDLTFNIPSSFNSRVLPGTLTEADGIIIDSTELMVQFSKNSYSGSEESGVVPVTLSLLGGTSTRDITVTVILSDRTAKGNGVDYISLPINATFTAGSTETTINVPISSDNIAEEPETFSLSFTIPSLLSGKIIPGSIITAVGTIIDNTITSVKFSQSTYSVNENSGVVQPVLVLSNPSSTDITVEVISTDGSATGGDDYQIGPYLALIRAEMTSVSFNISITNNNVLEVEENFELTINNSSLRNNVTVEFPDQATVTIVDDDVLSVEFARTSYRGSEGSGLISVTLQLIGGISTNEIAVTVTPSNQSPISAIGEVDYDTTPITATFPAGSTSTTVNISLIKDNIVEGPETFNINLTIPASLSGKVILGTVSNAIGNITDDTITTLRFNESAYSVDESSGVVQVVLVLSNSLLNALTVKVDIINATDFGKGRDYDSGPFTVSFPAGHAIAILNISINNDKILEEDEYFVLSIDKSSLPRRVIVGDPDEAIVTIADDDDVTVSFNESSYSVDENDGVIELTLILSNPSSTDINVHMMDNIGSATNGVDYISGRYAARFYAGMTVTSFTIEILNDGNFEDKETFDVVISPNKLPKHVSVGKLHTTTVTITDFATVKFDQPVYTAAENSQEARPTVVLQSDRLGDRSITVELFATDGTATGNVDYENRPFTLKFTRFVTEFRFKVSIIDDNIFEGNENFSLTIDSSELPNNIIVVQPSEAVIEISDNDDVPTVHFEQPVYTVNENKEVNPVLILTGLLSIQIDVRVTTIDGSATGYGNLGIVSGFGFGSAFGSGLDPTDIPTSEIDKKDGDYAAGPYRVTFRPGNMRASFNVFLVDDSIFEGNENFTLIVRPSKRNKVGSPSVALVNIVDDEVLTVSFEQPAYSVDESDGSVDLVLVLSNPSSGDIDIQILTVDGSATGRMKDYISGPHIATFPAGITYANVSIQITNDNIFEGNENFTLAIDSSSLPSYITISKPLQATVDIIDDDPITISFNESTYNVDESAELLQSVLVLSNPSSTNITVEVFSIDGSATGGEEDYNSGSGFYFAGRNDDYNYGPYMVQFNAGEIHALLLVSINNDNILEGNETFYLAIDSSSLPNSVSVDNGGQTTVNILDDDIATVSFEQQTYNVNEADENVEPVLVLSNPSSTVITIEVSSTDGLATGGGVDYNSGPYSVQFDIEVTRASFNILINDDDIFEDNETFTLSITRSSQPDGVIIGDQGHSTVTILQSDVATVSFNQSMYNVSEGDGELQVLLALSNPSSIDITIVITDKSYTALGGDDYVSGPYNASFTAGTTIASFIVSIINDGTIEDNEDFILTISSSSVQIVDPDQATVTVEDDDAITVFFNESSYSVVESDGSVQPVLVLSNASSTNITVSIININVNNSAIANVDYDFGPYSVTFTAGVTSVSFDVTIFNDNLSEINEEFDLAINNAFPPHIMDKISIGDPGQATVTIVDDDDVAIHFMESRYVVVENNGAVQLVLVLTKPSSTEITVEVMSNDITATGGVDYSSGPYTVIFPAGYASVTFNVSINDDNILDDRESFNLTIIPSSLPVGINVITPAQVTVTIVDDEVATVSFKQPTYAIDENDDDPLQIVLVLNKQPSMDFIVQVRENGNTAAGDKDYTSGPYSVTFPTGVTEASFYIAITNDNIVEGNENFSLVIDSSSTSAGVTDEAAVTIVDDDVGTVFFSQLEYNVEENVGILQPELILTNPLSKDFTIKIQNTDNTANGEDYHSGPYTVIISAGNTSASFDVMIIDDNVFENPENFLLTIDESSLPLLVTAAHPEATVNIMDNDYVTVTFTQSTYTFNENDGVVQLPIVLSNPSSFIVIVRVRDTERTAIRGEDYEVISDSVTIPAKQIHANFSISLLNDDISEENKNFDLLIRSRNTYERGKFRKVRVTIVDDDNDATVYFNQSTFTANESDGTVQIILVLSKAIFIDVTILIRSNDNTATGDDYDFTTRNVTIPSGKTHVSFDVSITNDDKLEEKEDFTLMIVSSSQSTVSVTNPNQTVVVIVDDDEVNVVVGDNVKVGVGERVIIDCGPLIDNSSVPNIMVKWYFNGFDLSNGTSTNVVISQDKRLCIITRTLLSVGGELGNNGNYTCEVCSDPNTCMTRSTITDICGEPNIVPPINEPVIFPSFAALTCGQNVTIPSDGMNTLSFSCQIFNGSDITTTEVFKNGIATDYLFLSFDITSVGDTDFGNYTFVVSTKRCGSTSAVSWVLPDCSIKGQVIEKCASHPDCAKTCKNTNGLVCIQQCIPYGCECPNGTVIDEQKNECVAASECPVTCPVKGQVLKNCTSCATTCTTRFHSTVCPINCTHDESRCECPDGTVIDEDRNKCVSPDKCPEIPCPAEGQSYSSNCRPLNATCSNPSPPSLCDFPMCSCPIGQVLNEELTKCINVSECISCPALTAPSNGVMNCSLGDDEVPSYEDTCSFTCNTGYGLPGSEIRTCQSNGSWSGSDVTCGITDNCNITKITGRFVMNKKLKLKFSGGPPETMFQCKVDNNQDFMDCESPLELSKNVSSVIVRAFCLVNGEPKLQKRRRFNMKMKM